jgi:hypothetical protein
MGILNRLTTKGTKLSLKNGQTPPINPGATKQSKLHADGTKPSYSMNGDNAQTVTAAYVAYNDGYNNALPRPSRLDLNGVTPLEYLKNQPQ